MNKFQFSKLFALANIAVNNSYGFTVDAQTLEPITKGYAVALVDTQNSFGISGLAKVVEYINNNKRVNAVGGWLDTESNKYYFDATVVLDDLADAIELGKSNGQIAIFDLNKKEEIRL